MNPTNQTYLQDRGYRSLGIPGRTAWVREKTDHFAVLIDAENYFQKLYEACEHAKQTVFICGWDIDSRTALIKNDDGSSALDHQLYYFLRKLVARNKNLEIYLLCWNYSIVFSIERELWPMFKSWGERIHFILDKHHPLLSSHHQKFVVIDDQIAFIGGIDICENRWDTSHHHIHSAKRKNCYGYDYLPWHDIQCMVSGNAAQRLGSLFRERWFFATREVIGETPSPRIPVWDLFSKTQLHIQDVNLFFCRTQPKYKSQKRSRENFLLTLDLLKIAKKFVYIENQYLTSRKVRKQIEKRLAETDGPEIIVVLPKFPFGWLESITIAILQTRAIRRIRAKDTYGRFQVFYPQLSPNEDIFLYVHSKIIIVDDLYLKIGSCNINNRSMGLDTEIDLLFEAKDEGTEEFIRQVRRKLLSEHMNQSMEWFKDQENRMSLLSIIDSQKLNPRTLQILKPTSHDWIDFITPHIPFFDSPHPIHIGHLFYYYYVRIINFFKRRKN
ncbi:MAG: phospholipase D-like domain-containing protein [Pseudobdellovibrionaceae bacterium]